MENNTPQLQIINNSNLEKEPKLFDYKKKAKKLIIAGFIGILLSIVYYYMSAGCDMGEHRCDSYEKQLNTVNTNYQSIYYISVAILFLISGLLLNKKNKIGIYMFMSSFVFVAVSFFLPSDLATEHNLVLFSNSLFVNSIQMALLGSILIYFLPIIGVLIYFWYIIYNLLSLTSWANLLNVKRIKLNIFSLILGILCLVIFYMVNIPTIDKNSPNFGAPLNLPSSSIISQ